MKQEHPLMVQVEVQQRYSSNVSFPLDEIIASHPFCKERKSCATVIAPLNNDVGLRNHDDES